MALDCSQPEASSASCSSFWLKEHMLILPTAKVMEQMVFGTSCTGLGRLDSESTEAQHWGIDHISYWSKTPAMGKKMFF